MSTTPTKSKQVLLQDTPSKSHPISQHGAVTKPIEAQRDMLLESTQGKIVSGPIDDFVARYMPFMSSKDALVNAVTEKLKAGKDCCLNEDGWVTIKKQPGLNEDATFAEVANIANAVYEKAVEHDPTLKDQRTTILECRPHQTVAGEVPGASFKSDAIATATKKSLPENKKPEPVRRQSPRLQAKNQAIFYGDVTKETRNASDAGLFGEFKLHWNPASVLDNERKIVGGSAFILFNDPCRRFTFGFTVEDYSLRLWYFSRGHIAVSDPVDFHKSPHHFVRFLLFVTFAPREALGYDSTVKRVSKTGDQGEQEIVYHYKVGEDWYETIGKPIHEDKCADIVTHAPRVWKVKKVLNDNGDLATDVNVLKDYWLYDDAKTESEIQGDIFDRLHQLDAHNAAQGNPTDHKQAATPYFMTILADESVLLENNSRDETSPCLENSTPFKYTMTEKVAAPAVVPGARRTTGRDKHRDSPSARNGATTKLQLLSRFHQRIVFKEMCDTLWSLRNFQTYVDCLASVAKGLYFLRIAGYVHRDISPGNCLYCDGRVIITDLEYAKPHDKVSIHDPLTGTAAFMAVETQQRKHLFKGRPTSSKRVAWFKFNYLHDLESILWMYIWFLLQRIPIPLLPQLSQVVPPVDLEHDAEPVIAQLCTHIEMLFDRDCTGSADRSQLVQTADHSVFPVLHSIYDASSTFDFVTDSLFELVLMFGDWYKAVESEAPLYADGSPRWKDELFKVEYHETLFTVLSDIAKRVGSVEVKSVKQHEADMQRNAGGHPVDVEDGSSGDKRKRNGKDDGTVEKEADASTKGSKRNKTGQMVTSRKRTSRKSNR